MNTDLDALVTALYVTVDDLLIDHPDWGPERPEIGIAPRPLTRIRSELDVDLAHPDTADAVATHRSVLEEIEQMQRLVEDLLILARHDNLPSTPAAARVVDLDDIVLDEIHRHPNPTVEIDTSAVSAAQVTGNPAQLARLVRNLLDNAIRHARTTVTVTLSEHDDTAILTITDDGPGIPTVDHERVFERLTRLDFARANADGGSGLGLAIARAIVADHHGTIAFDPHHHPGARLIVHIPTTTISTRHDTVERNLLDSTSEGGLFDDG